MFNKDDKDNRLVDSNGYILTPTDLQKSEEQLFLEELSTALQDVDNEPREMPPLIKENPHSPQPPKKKRHIGMWIFFALLSLTGAAVGGAWWYVDINKVKLVTFQGEEQLMTNVTPDKFKDMYESLTVTFVEGDKKEVYTYKDLGIEIKWTEYQQAQFENFKVNLDDMFVYFNYSQKLKDIIHSLNDERQIWLSATFEDFTSEFLITPEQKGNRVYIDQIEQYVKDNFGLTSITINLDDYKEPQPEHWVTDVEFRNEMDRWESFQVTYTNGFTVTKDVLKPFFKLDAENKIVYDETKDGELNALIESWLDKELNSYNTLGGTHTFITHAGEQVQLKGVNYGDVMNRSKEFTFLKEVITNLWSCSDRIPEMSTDYPDDIQSNVIEISIGDQHLWYWQNGEVYMETDIVTGWKNKWDTPKGVYRILNMIDGVYLIGADYKTWVDKWMRIWNGYGLHDATWRNKFGGTIYQKDGSHGCINLPPKFAATLYDMVEPGDCVVIY